MTRAVLSLKSVVKYVGPDKVLDSVDLDALSGEVVVVRGRSGVGKTTLAKIAALLSRPDAGRVVFLGIDVTRGASQELRLRHVGYVDQFFRLMPGLTACENAELPLKLMGVPKSTRVARVKEVLEELGLLEKCNKYPSELSGGERQRVAIARALVKKPTLLVADEPLSNLDDEAASKVLELFRELAKSGAAVVITTTDLYTDLGADKDYVLSSGKLREVTSKK